VYRAFDRLGLGSSMTQVTTPEWQSESEAIAALRALGNDLEPAARALLPDIGVITTELMQLEGVRYAALSGSGATVFAIVENLARAEQLADELIARHPDWWVQEAVLGA
jgi:4-diphosphocytidyl-2-C-methyl-D-erythritol kinase